MMQTLSLQERYSPNGICFGCGPKNIKGLHVRSFVQDDNTLIATWQPQTEHQAFFPRYYVAGLSGQS